MVMPDKRSAEISEKYAEISSTLASEKSGGDFAEIPLDFYDSLRELVNDLEAMLNREREGGFNKRAARLQDMLDNIRKHSEKFYRFRVRKIFRLAHNSVGKKTVNKRGLAAQEIEMLDEFFRILDHYSYLVNFSRDENEMMREIEKGIAAEEKREKDQSAEVIKRKSGVEGVEGLEKAGTESAVSAPEEVFEEKKPLFPAEAKEQTDASVTEASAPREKEAGRVRKERSEADAIKELPMTEKGDFSEELPEKTALVRVLYDLPDIAGAGTDYRMRREDILVLPEVIARVLLKGGKVELISYNL